MDMSSGQEDGHGNSTASSGSSASNGSNDSTATSTTRVSAILYGNLRRFCGLKKDADGSQIWPPQIIAPRNSNKDGARLSSCTRNSAINVNNSKNDITNTQNVIDNKNDTHIFRNSMNFLNFSDQDSINSILNGTSNSNNATVASDNCSDVDVSNNTATSNENKNIVSSFGKSTPCNNITIKTTAKTRVYLSKNAKTRIIPPKLPHPADLPQLRDHIHESEDEDLQDKTNSTPHSPQTQDQAPKRQSQRQIRVGKTTTVLFAVTLAYILSFLPYLTVMVMRSVIKDLEENLSPVGELAYKLCVKSFFINNAINPLIYSFLNQAFRQDAKLMLSRMCGRNRSSSQFVRAMGDV